MSGIQTNRTNLTLPVEISREIMQKTAQGSAIMRLAQRQDLPGRGLTIPTITGDPEANWVDETNVKPAANPSVGTKNMKGYTLAVIVPFSNQFRRDLRALYDAIVQRLPAAIGRKFDSTVIGTVAPGTGFDVLGSCTAQSLIASGGHTTYKGLVAAYTDIADHSGALDGFALSPAAEGILLNAVDSTGRPIFTGAVSENNVSPILGARVISGRGLYKAGSAAVGTTPGTPAIVGIAGDWTQARYGVVEDDVQISISDQATLTIGTERINLWERNMFAVRAEIEVGFVADSYCFNLLTGAVPEA